MQENKKNVASGIFPMPCGIPPISLPEGDIGIADLSSLFDVSHRTLHFYEEKQLISSRRLGQMRIYGPNEVSRMWLVHSCREIGMSIADIQNLLADLSKASDRKAASAVFEAHVSRRSAEIESETAALHDQKKKAAQLLNPEIRIPPKTDAVDEAESDEDSDVQFSTTDRSCLRLMAAGSNAETIAEALDVDAISARELEESIVSRLEARNRLHAVTLAAIRRII